MGAASGIRAAGALALFAAGASVFLAPLPAAAQQEPPDGLAAALVLEKAVTEAIARCEKSVVAIARGKRGRMDELLSRDYVPQEFGAGVVVDKRGYILTNYHVLGDPESSDYAVWVAGKAYPVRDVAARQNVTAADPWSDLAILKIDAPDLVPMPLGDAKAVKKGQFVIALGNPYAIARDGEPSASWGIIANLGRKAAPNPDPDENNPSGKETMHHYGTLLQTDARLNLGTSGGALVNLKGEMIGLTTSLAATAGFERAAGFAIPVDDAFRRIVQDLIAGKEVAYGFLGVRLEGPERIAFRLEEGTRGAVVMAVYPGTPAAKSGLVSGDVITHVDGRAVIDPDDLILQVGRLPVERVVRLTVQRGGRSFQRDLALSKKPPSSERPSIVSAPLPAWRGLRVDYCTAAPNLVQHSVSGLLDPAGCVAIVAVDLESPAWKAGLRPGLFLNQVEGARVTTPAEFYRAVANRTGPVRVMLTRAPGPEGPERVVSP